MHILILCLILPMITHAADTLRPASFADTCARKNIQPVGEVPDLVTYVYTPQSQFAGFICGNSDLNLPVKAQKYATAYNPATLTAIAYWFGEKILTDSFAVIRGMVFAADMLTGAPGTLLAITDSFPATAIDTSNRLTVLPLPSPVLLPDTFFVALDVSGVSGGNYVGLLSTKDGCYSGKQLAWERDSLGNWHPFNDGTTITSWGLNIDMAIFPIGDFGLHTSIERTMPESLQVTLEANHLHIRFHLQTASALTLTLIDRMGRQMWQQQTPQAANGLHQIQTVLPPLSSGLYLLTFAVGGETHVQKIFLSQK
ncbi:MAG: hypothetical protein KatS3mg031_2644 [Chitinophagales bacterium]|nr:MAG: hypothetical protein KatS3mg031_2644 [Chitinophagales bacterium]